MIHLLRMKKQLHTFLNYSWLYSNSTSIAVDTVAFSFQSISASCPRCIPFGSSFFPPFRSRCLDSLLDGLDLRFSELLLKPFNEVVHVFVHSCDALRIVLPCLYPISFLNTAGSKHEKFCQQALLADLPFRCPVNQVRRQCASSAP
jgi:hypothetical protein